MEDFAVRRRIYGYKLLTVLCAMVCLSAANLAQADGPEATARRILRATGVKGGVVVHLGCDDGRLTAVLHANDSYLVHGLDASAADVQKARSYVRGLDIYGPVSVSEWGGKSLPYAGEFVNLVVASKGVDVSTSEIMRVLRPGGVAYEETESGWKKTVKQWPDDIDDWSHYLYDPTNNAISQDTRLGPPESLKWDCGPPYARSHEHLSSISTMVSAGGRVFYIIDEGPKASVYLPPRWSLVARDAFNGCLLWKKKIDLWESHVRGFRSGPPELGRRLVASEDRVYVTPGYATRVVQFDAATGERLRAYEGTKGAREILHQDGTLYVVADDTSSEKHRETNEWYEERAPEMKHYTFPREAIHEYGRRRIVAIDAETGKVIWRKADEGVKEIMPTTLALSDGRLCYQNTTHMVCLNATTGKEVWREDHPIARSRFTWSTPTLAVSDGVVLCADRLPKHEATKEVPPPGETKWIVDNAHRGRDLKGEIAAFSLKNGEVLWRAPCYTNYDVPRDVFVVDEVVWTGRVLRTNAPGFTRGRDLHTGEVVATRPPDTDFFSVGMGHHRCYRNRGTLEYLLTGRAGVEYVDLDSGKSYPNHWIRGACQYGIMPANGLLYVPQDSCGCYVRAKLTGLSVLASGSEDREDSAKEVQQLVKGPAYGQLDAMAGQTQKVGWRTYRHDASRSGATEKPLPEDLARDWDLQLDSPLTPPVVADGKLFVAEVDRHRLCALNAGTGELQWDFTAGGRIDSPPTVHRGFVLFGSRDGRVYCLRAKDGELAWAFRAVPKERVISSYGQLESTWPIHGTVLVHDGLAYFAAGRSSFLNGGIRVFALDPTTGEVKHRSILNSREPKSGRQPKGLVDRFTLREGALTDVMSAEDDSVFMRQKCFDLKVKEQAQKERHLYAPAGFLNKYWWHRTYWQYGESMGGGYHGWHLAGNRNPAGRLLVFDDDTFYGFGRMDYDKRQGGHPSKVGPAYRLFAQPRMTESEVKEAQKKARRSRNDGEKRYAWTVQLPFFVRAMVLAGDQLHVIGPSDLSAVEPEIQTGAGAHLWTISTEDGSSTHKAELDAPPVFDGMAAAGNRLFVCTENGKVVSFTGR